MNKEKKQTTKRKTGAEAAKAYIDEIKNYPHCDDCFSQQIVEDYKPPTKEKTSKKESS